MFVERNDFCFAGSKAFEYEVINELRKLFKIKSEEVAKFQYIGLEIKKNPIVTSRLDKMNIQRNLGLFHFRTEEN